MLIVVALAAAAVVALTSDGDADASATPTSYCGAALRALRYSGDDADHFRTLLDPVADLAPHALKPAVTALRRAPLGSTVFDRARQRWQRETTDQCCDCIGGQHAPTVVGAKPDS